MSSSPPSDWREVELGDLVEVEHGYAFKSEHFTPGGADDRVVVSVGNFRYEGGFRFESTEVKGYRGEYPARFELAPGDILLVMTCQTQGGEILGIPGRIPADGRVYLHNQRLGKVVFRSDDLDQRFAYWLFIWSRFNLELCRTASGSKILHTAPNRIKRFRFGLPSVAEQKSIASVLDAIDDKIESNERRGALHAEMIDAMFSHHVLARDEPGDTDGDLTSIARFVNGGAFTRGATGAGRPVLRIKELNSGISDATVFNEIDAKDDNIARHHDLLFSWSGSLDVYRWHGPEALINQHIFKVLPLDGFSVWFVEGWIRRHLPEFQGIAKDKATTMGHIKREHLNQAAVRIPPRAVIEQLDHVLSPLDTQMGALAREATTLRALRNELLPKLVSGEIRVAAASAEDQGGELAA